MRIRNEFALAIGPSNRRQAEADAFNFSAPLEPDQASQLFDSVRRVGKADLADRQALADLDALPMDKEADWDRRDQVRDEIAQRWSQLKPEMPDAALRLAQAAQQAAGSGVLFGEASALPDGILAIDLHRQTSNEHRSPTRALEGLAGDRFVSRGASATPLMEPDRLGVLMVDTLDGVAFLRL